MRHLVKTFEERVDWFIKRVKYYGKYEGILVSNYSKWIISTAELKNTWDKK